MKLEDVKNGDCFSGWFFTKEEADSKLFSIKHHLTEKELKAQDTTLIKYSISIPDDYVVSNAAHLMAGLFNGYIESEDYDELAGKFHDSSMIEEVEC